MLIPLVKDSFVYPCLLSTLWSLHMIKLLILPLRVAHQFREGWSFSLSLVNFFPQAFPPLGYPILCERVFERFSWTRFGDKGVLLTKLPATAGDRNMESR
jgi:hypothetical protein